MASRVPKKKKEEEIKINVSVNADVPEVSKTTAKETENVADEEVIPDYSPKSGEDITKVLKLYDTLELVYVGKRGRLYDASTFKKYMDDTAILYKNPYFKK